MTGNPDTFFFFKARLLLKIFIYLFIAVLGLCCCLGFSLVVVSGGDSLLAVIRLLIAVIRLLLLQSMDSRVHGLQ